MGVKTAYISSPHADQPEYWLKYENDELKGNLKNLSEMIVALNFAKECLESRAKIIANSSGKPRFINYRVIIEYGDIEKKMR